MGGAKAVWTTADLLKLVGRIRSNTQKSEKTTGYQLGLLSVNWDETAFPPYSAKQCRNKWKEVMKKMRKLKSLSELVAEAEEVVSKPLLPKRSVRKRRSTTTSRRTRTSPREPKMPTQNLLIYFARYQNMSSAKSKKLWDELPIKEKERYKEHKRLTMKQYSENLQQWFKELTPEEQMKYLKQNPKKLQFLESQENLVNEREELCLSQPSDSEDEDITKISSEDDIWSSYEDESDEDWNMFEMHR